MIATVNSAFLWKVLWVHGSLFLITYLRPFWNVMHMNREKGSNGTGEHKKTGSQPKFYLTALTLSRDSLAVH